MAVVRTNSIVENLSGKLGKEIYFRRLPDGRTIMCAKQDFSGRVFSPAQKSHQERFRQAAAYARQAARTEPLYAELAARSTKTAYNLALSDWFHAPVVRNLSWRDGILFIAAEDNVAVCHVMVRVLGADGEERLREEAARVSEGLWELAFETSPEAGSRIDVTARDLAGNEAQAVLVIPGQG